MTPSNNRDSVFLPPPQTRLVTICAHVDHGKTTLADNLIAANGLIGERLAGTLRYLDSDEEEQRRGITMRASAIGLRHDYLAPKSTTPTRMIFHLVDSPGHADFSAEVTSSFLACDAALIVIDVVEGMGARTHQVLREAHRHQLEPILVFNKLDRLCTDLCLTPLEAYLRLRTTLETVNAACSSMLTSAWQFIEMDDKAKQQEERRWTFDAARNIVFGSAYHGWGFTSTSLARSLFRSKTIHVKPLQLRQAVFGDYYYKNGKILKWKASSEVLPIFAEYALEPLWQLYDCLARASASVGTSTLFADGRYPPSSTKDGKLSATTPGMDEALMALQTGATGKMVPPPTPAALNEVLTKTGSSNELSVVRTLLRRYRPLSECVLDTVCECGPSPEQAAQRLRASVLTLQRPPTLTTEFVAIQESVQECRREGPTVAVVCKYIAVPSTQLGGVDPTACDTAMLAVVRVLSGRLEVGHEYYCLGPTYQPGDNVAQRTVYPYLLMGAELIAVQSVPAGHLCAVYNLEQVHLRSLTLVDNLASMPLRGFERHVRPLVKVNVEAESASDTAALEAGLQRLALADDSVEVTLTAKGERLLACLGELHLEQSLKDLERFYCGGNVSVRISDPIIDFGETTDWFAHEFDYTAFYDDHTSPPLHHTTIPPYNEEEGLSSAQQGRSRTIVSGRTAAVRLRVVPLAPLVREALEEKAVVEGSEEGLVQLGKALGLEDSSEAVLHALVNSVCSLGPNGNVLVETPSLRKGTSVRGVTSDLGEVYVPKSQVTKDEEVSEHVGRSEFEELRDMVRSTGFRSPDADALEASTVNEEAYSIWTKELNSSAVAGFQLATRAGPICEEPMRNIMVVLEGVEIALLPSLKPKHLSGGMLVAAFRSGIRSALLTRPARLVEGILRLTLHSSLTGLGSLYEVLSKRRGKVIDDSMVDGTDLLLITARLPQAEAFGLAPELYSKTSGEVTAPEMVFDGWQRLDVDPFWVPTTEEEREDFGEWLVTGDASTGIDNVALKYIRSVRKRKGLMVDSSRTVFAAEKQRTLKR